MGISDLIPGVSGGTIALITGIYNDFIHSLNNIKLKNIIKLFKGSFFTNLTYFKFDVLFMIVFGIFSSIIIFSQIISNAIDIHPTKVFSFFFGLILASIPYIIRGISLFKIKNFVIFVASIILLLNSNTGSSSSNKKEGILLRSGSKPTHKNDFLFKICAINSFLSINLLLNLH